MAITTLPAPPLRSDGPATFADKGDAFMAALPAFAIEANALGAQVTADAAAVAAAAPGAVAAANFKGEYAGGTTYQVGQSVSYGGDTWYAKTVNLGVTPVAGAAWQRVVAIPSQTGQAGKVLTTDGNVPSWIPLEVVGDHQIIVHSGNGHGSTNNCIRRYTTTKANVGAAIVYADSSTLGASFTIQPGFGGLYAVAIRDKASAGTTVIGVSNNATSLSVTPITGQINNLTGSQRIAFFSTGSGYTNTMASASSVVRLNAGDVVRPHTNSNPDATLEHESEFSIIRVGL